MNKSSSNIEDGRSLETINDINGISSVQTKKEKADETDVSRNFMATDKMNVIQSHQTDSSATTSDIEKSTTGMFRESDAGDGTHRGDQIITSKKKLAMCSFALCLCMFLISLDQMITTTVLTTVSDHFGEFDKLTWITAAYVMAMGCFAQFWGRVSINFGRKWVLVVGMAIFEIGSLICALATSMNMLIAGRALQGVGSSCIESLVMIIASEICSISDRPLLLATMGITFVGSSVLGPLLGGVFSIYLSWRWCFYFNLCCATIILPLFIFTYHPKPPTTTFHERLRTIDFLDNFLLIASFFLLLLAVSLGQTEPSWGSTSVICCFAVGVPLLVAFCIWNFRYSSHPTIPQNVFCNRQILICLGIFIAGFSCLMVAMQFLSVYLQNVIGHNAFHTGLSLLPLALSSCFAAMFSAGLTHRFSHIKIFALISGILLPISLALFTLLQPVEHLGTSIGLQIFLGIAAGVNFQAPMLTALLFAPKDPGSTILTTAMMNFARSIGIAFCSNIAGDIYTASLRYDLRKIASLLDDSSFQITSILSNAEVLKTLTRHDQNLIKTKMTAAIHNVFWMAFGISVFSMFLTFFMSNRKLPKTDEIEESQR